MSATINVSTRPMPAATRSARRVSAWAIVGGLALAALVAAAALIVLIAAQRPSDLVPPSVRGGFAPWLAGPLHSLLPGLPRSSTTNDNTFSELIVAMFVLWLIVLATARSLPLRLAIAGVVALHVVLLLAPPLALTDVFNYLNYARMGALHHLNPYVATPATRFEYAHDPAGIFSNWHHLKSPYGPLFTLATYPLAYVSVPVAFWIFKSFVVAASLGAVLLTARCATRLGRSPVVAVVLVGLGPVAMIWGIGGQHNDSFMVLFIVGAIALWIAGRDGWAAALLVGACALKISALPLVPLFLLGCNDRRAALRGTAIAAVAMGVMSYVAFGAHLPDFGTQAKMVNVLSIPNQFGWLIGIGGQTATLRTVMFGVFGASALVACAFVWRGTSWLTAAGWVLVASLLTTGWLLPWYIAWLAPFAALAPTRKLLVPLVVISAFLIATSIPSDGVELHWLHYHPTTTAVGRANQQYLFEHLR
jgi:alpha-1,6-mannosyltransferase